MGGGSADINLGDFRTLDLANVRDREAHVIAIGGSRNSKTGISKLRVGKSMAKGEQRLDILLVEPAVSNSNTFGKFYRRNVARSGAATCA